MDKLQVTYKRFLPSLIIVFILVVIIGLAVFFRFYEITKLSFWTDEIISAKIANKTIFTVFSIIWTQDPNMSLFNLLLWLFVHILPNAFGEILRIMPAILSVFSIPMVFILGRSIISDEKRANLVGLIAAFFVAINAFHIQYAQELRSYSLVFLLTTISTYFLIKAIENPKSKLRWLGYALITIASIYSHLLAVFILIAQMFSLLILIRNKKFRFPYKNVILSFVLIFIILMPLVYAAYGARYLLINWIPMPSFNYFLIFLTELSGNQGIILTGLYLIFSVLGLLFEAKLIKKQEKVFNKWKLTLLVNCLILPILIALLISVIFRPIFWDRYFLFVMPYLAILAALGISSIINFRSWNNYKNYLVVLLLITFFYLSTIGIRNYFTNFQKEDVRGVAAFTSEKCINSFKVYYPFGIILKVSYYNPNLKLKAALLPLPVRNRYAFNKIAPILEENFTKFSQVCLVVQTNTSHFQSIKEENYNEVIKLQHFFGQRYQNKTETKFYGYSVFIYSK